MTLSTGPRRNHLRKAAARTLVAAVALSTAVALVPNQATAATAAPDSTTAVPTSAGANDHVLYWNTVLLDAFRAVGGTPGPLTRGGAIMNLSIYDAVNSIGWIGKPWRTQDWSAFGNTGALNTAVDYAAYTALTGAFPGRTFDSQLATALALPNRGNASDQETGRLLGINTANAVLADRANDGSTDTTPYVATIAPGYWRPAPNTPAGAPNWGKVKPWGLASGAQFRPAHPGGFATANDMLKSPDYAAQVNEIKAVGAKNSTVRTADQTQIAHFWANDLNGTYKPVGQQYDHTITIFRAYRPYADSFTSAKLFGVFSATLADAAISIWDSKYDTGWDEWRPFQAIQLNDTTVNPAIVADPTWQPLESDTAGNSFTPNFPSYASGHSGIAGAWAGALQNYFRTDGIAFTGGTDDPFAVGVTRSFTSLSQAAHEKADSRKYIGVHFEWDNSTALTMGYQVANFDATLLDY